VRRTNGELPVTAFVHVVDCRVGRPSKTESRARTARGHAAALIQYWFYYANSATLRDTSGRRRGFPRGRLGSVPIPPSPDGEVDQRASYRLQLQARRGWGSDAGLEPLEDIAESLGARAENGWGPETHLLLVSGGSHAGNAAGGSRGERYTPGRRVHLIPLEPIAADGSSFAVSPPWKKKVWLDPEAEGTD
jgi:hypothetical protein